MSTRNWMAVGIVSSAMFAVQASATVLLDVNFEDHTLGNINGQSGGVSSGTWNAPWTTGATQKLVISSPAIGTKAASLSRDSGVNSDTTIDLAAPQLDTSLSSIYYSFDFYRADDNDRGVITLRNNLSFNNTGLGISIENGASPFLRLITGGGFAGQDTTYTIENAKWHRVEFEASGATDQYDVFVQKEGVAGRLQIGDNIAWAAPNGTVHAFQYLAQGLQESNVVLDNLYLETGAAFPVDRPLVVPEPAAMALLALAGALTLRRRK